METITLESIVVVFVEAVFDWKKYLADNFGLEVDENGEIVGAVPGWEEDEDYVDEDDYFEGEDDLVYAEDDSEYYPDDEEPDEPEDEE